MIFASMNIMLQRKSAGWLIASTIPLMAAGAGPV